MRLNLLCLPTPSYMLESVLTIWQESLESKAVLYIGFLREQGE